MSGPAVTRGRAAPYRGRTSAGGAAAAAASAGLFAAAGMHAAWGAGSAWPVPDRAALADAVTGAAEVPGPGACFAVSGALAAAGALTAGWPARYPGLHRAGVVAVAAVLAGRGFLGLAGQTRLVSPGATSATFTRLDRRVYSPLCLALAGLSALSTGPPARAGWGQARVGRHLPR